MEVTWNSTRHTIDLIPSSPHNVLLGRLGPIFVSYDPVDERALASVHGGLMGETASSIQEALDALATTLRGQLAIAKQRVEELERFLA